MQVSDNAIIREMDAEELQEELERVRLNNTPLESPHLFQIELNYQQITGQSLIFPKTK